MNTRLSLLFLALLITFTGAASAQDCDNTTGGTPDGCPPAFEDPCEGLPGALFGLCNAYCEAKDCDEFPNSPSCDRIAANFANKDTNNEYGDALECGAEAECCTETELDPCQNAESGGCTCGLCLGVICAYTDDPDNMAGFDCCDPLNLDPECGPLAIRVQFTDLGVEIPGPGNDGLGLCATYTTELNPAGPLFNVLVRIPNEPDVCLQ